jgi:hypothetical protein
VNYGLLKEHVHVALKKVEQQMEDFKIDVPKAEQYFTQIKQKLEEFVHK